VISQDAQVLRGRWPCALDDAGHVVGAQRPRRKRRNDPQTCWLADNPDADTA
jgi:hypothetical protein